MNTPMTDDEEIELMRQLIAKHPGPASKIFATGLQPKPVPTLQEVWGDLIEVGKSGVRAITEPKEQK